MEELITDYNCGLAEAGCAPGSGFYALKVTLKRDIGAVLPYLNAVFENTMYDHDNKILICEKDKRGYAFRSMDIRVSGIVDVSDVPQVAQEVVDRVNQVWREREQITPSYKERKLPTVIDIYQLLPKTNCKQCGYLTCLAFAAELRTDPGLLVQCPPLWQSDYARNREELEALFSPGEVSQPSA
jgi:ArsR family metal-binding transcriptional regulator